MPLKIIRNDITTLNVDAIVNAANESLLGGGGVDGCIHRAAGPQLLAECRTLGGCKTGDAKITHAYDLPCKYVIHTPGPIWYGGSHGEKDLLISCYRRSMQLAEENGCDSVAFPLISSGIYGYPKAEALRVAVDTITGFLAETETEMDVSIVVFDKKSYKIGEKLFNDIAQFIDDNYVDEHKRLYPETRRRAALNRMFNPEEECMAAPQTSQAAPDDDYMMTMFSAGSLEDAVSQLDESFAEMLLRKIDESGMTDAECYKKANIDRKLFNKIKNKKEYKPSKPTVIAFAIALELSLDETKNMLMKAGFALSRSNLFDVIIEFFITKGIYNVFEINEALFAYDQSLLGA